MAIQVRRGNEVDFDPSKMLPGEWAVSLDTKYVRMCFSPGICLRMATYEAFEKDMEQILDVLEEAKTIEEAIQKIHESVQKAVIDVEIADQAAKIATQKAKEASESAINANNSETNSFSSAKEASTYAANAKTSETNAKLSEINALASEDSASASEKNAKNYSDISKSYAVGGTKTRENEDFDNAKYYYQQIKQISQGINGITPMGTVTFENLPTTNIVKNAMYNISNAFVSDDRFNDGGGVSYGDGSNVIWTAEGFWDVTASSGVNGVKGDRENTYRQGFVNITPSNIGAVAVNGDTADNITSFTSEDNMNPTEWTDIDLLLTKEKHSSLLNKVSNMFKNMRYLYNILGNTDISKINDGTVTGILSFILDKLTWKNVGANIGTTEIELPSIFNELLIKINVNNFGIILNIHVVYKELYQTKQEYRSGWYQNGTNGCMASFNIDVSTASLAAVFLNSDNVTDTTSWVVYYR